MAKEYLDKDGLLYFWQKIKSVFVSDVNYDITNKKITKTKNGTTSDVVTVATLKTDMNIDVGVTGVKGNSESTYRTGNVNITAGNVGAAASSHTHGNITNAGALQTTDVDIASGDKLVITDSSNSNKVARASAAFDGSTDTKALTKKGTFEDFAKPADIPTATSDLTNDSDFVSDSSYVHTDNNYTTTEKNKLAGIASGAEVNQNAFSNVKVGSTTVAADSKTDTLELVAGSNVTLTPDATNDKVTIAATDTTYSDATTSTHGLMSAADKTAVDKTKSFGIFFDDEATIHTNDASYRLLSYDTNTEARVLGIGSKGAANGVCPLNSSSKIDSTYLPSYVDDVIEAYARSGQTALSSTWLATGSASGTVITPETGKIYVLMADSGDYAANTQFRWGGTAYVKLADGGVSSITNAEIDTIVAS